MRPQQRCVMAGRWTLKSFVVLCLLVVPSEVPPTLTVGCGFAQAAEQEHDDPDGREADDMLMKVAGGDTDKLTRMIHEATKRRIKLDKEIVTHSHEITKQVTKWNLMRTVAIDNLEKKRQPQVCVVEVVGARHVADRLCAFHSGLMPLKRCGASMMTT